MLAGSACNGDSARQGILEASFVDSNQKPVAGIPVTLNGSPVGKTDARGALKFDWRASVGDQVTFRAGIPEGLEPAPGSSSQKTIMIGQFQNLGKTLRTADGIAVETVSWEVELKRQDVAVQVVVESGCPNMAVALVNPAQPEGARTVAFTDRNGVGLVSLKLPEEQVYQIRLLTGHVPEIQPSNPISRPLTAKKGDEPVVLKFEMENCHQKAPEAAAWVRLFTQPANANVFIVMEERRRWLGLATAEGLEIPIESNGEYTFRAEKQGHLPAEIRLPLSAENPTLNPVIDLVLERQVEALKPETTVSMTPAAMAQPAAPDRPRVVAGSKKSEPEQVDPQASLPVEKVMEKTPSPAAMKNPQAVEPEPAAARPAPASAVARPGAGSLTVQTRPSGINVLLVAGGKESMKGTTSKDGLTVGPLSYGSHLLKLVDPATGFAKLVRVNLDEADPSSAMLEVDMVRAQTLHRLERIWKDYTESGRVGEEDRKFLETLRDQPDADYKPARTILNRLESIPPAP